MKPVERDASANLRRINVSRDPPILPSSRDCLSLFGRVRGVKIRRGCTGIPECKQGYRRCFREGENQRCYSLEGSSIAVDNVGNVGVGDGIVMQGERGE